MATNVAATAALRLPTARDYGSLTDATQRGLDLLEDLVEQLRPLDPDNAAGDKLEFEWTRAPTYADVGSLWSFAQTVRLQVETMASHVTTLETYLRELDLQREDASVRELHRERGDSSA
jgi:hypothetical protein